MTYDWIYIGLFILYIATMTYPPGRIDWTQTRISNYFDEESPGCRARSGSLRDASGERLSCAVCVCVCVIILRRDTLPQGERGLPYSEEALTRSTITVLHPLPHVTISHVRMCGNFSMFLGAPAPIYPIPTYRKLNFDSVYGITSQNSILNQCFHKSLAIFVYIHDARNGVTNQLTRPKRIFTVWSIYFS